MLASARSRHVFDARSLIELDGTITGEHGSGSKRRSTHKILNPGTIFKAVHND